MSKFPKRPVQVKTSPSRKWIIGCLGCLAVPVALFVGMMGMIVLSNLHRGPQTVEDARAQQLAHQAAMAKRMADQDAKLTPEQREAAAKAAATAEPSSNGFVLEEWIKERDARIAEEAKMAPEEREALEALRESQRPPAPAAAAPKPNASEHCQRWLALLEASEAGDRRWKEEERTGMPHGFVDENGLPQTWEDRKAISRAIYLSPHEGCL